jgi:hypothetical protein
MFYKIVKICGAYWFPHDDIYMTIETAQKKIEKVDCQNLHVALYCKGGWHTGAEFVEFI